MIPSSSVHPKGASPFDRLADISVTAGTLSLTCIILATLIMVHILPYLRDHYELRRYPGPPLAKLTDLWFSWTVSHNRWTATVHELHKKHGTFVRLAPKHISIADPRALHEIYGHGSGALKASFYDSFSSSGFPNIFNTRSREEHARKRHFQAHLFAPQSIYTAETIVAVHVEALVRRWDIMCAYSEQRRYRSAATEGKMGSVPWKTRRDRIWFDSVPCFTFWAFDASADLAYGVPFGMIDAARDITRVAKPTRTPLDPTSEAEGIPVVEVFSARAEVVITLGFLPSYWRPLVGRLPQFQRHAALAPKAAGVIVSAVKQRLSGGEEKDDMLRRLLEAREREGGESAMSVRELIAETFVLINAGADTVANSAMAITYYVARDLRVQEILQAELDSALAGGAVVAPYEAAKDLPYLTAVINEGLRVHSTVGAGLPRLVPPGGMTILGRRFAAGTCVSAPIYTIHRSAAAWGPDAEVFRPERWLENAMGQDAEGGRERRKQMLEAFAPFSLGPRACIGRNLALMELHVLIATLFRRYSFVLESDAPLSVHDFLARKPERCLVGLKRRNS